MKFNPPKTLEINFKYCPDCTGCKCVLSSNAFNIVLCTVPGSNGSIEAPYAATWPAARVVLEVPIVSETTEAEVVDVEKCSITKGQRGEQYPSSSKSKKG